MTETVKFKWFWGINYVLSVYKLLLLTSLAIPVAGIESETDWFKLLYVGDITYLIAYFGEWIQFPICLVVILFFKSQRTIFHFLYLFLILLSVFATFLIFGLLMGSLGG